MTYVSWAALYEGTSDEAYFGVLLPRLMDALILERGRRLATIPIVPSIVFQRGAPDRVAIEACEARDAFHLVFMHADTGGRAQAERAVLRDDAYCEMMQRQCEWNPRRCVLIAPRHETEAWILCDSDAVLGALGYRGQPEAVGLPRNAREAERLPDPKAVLNDAIDQVRGRRRRSSAVLLFPAIAQRQSLDRLRESHSFVDFETRLIGALADLGFVMRRGDVGCGDERLLTAPTPAVTSA